VPLFIVANLFVSNAFGQTEVRLPDGDVTVASWNTSPLFSKINASGGSVIVQPDNSNSTAEVSFQNPSNAGTYLGVELKFIARKGASGGNQRGLNANIRINGVLQGVKVVEDDLTATLSTSTVSWTGLSFTQAQMNTLQVQFLTTGTITGAGGNRRTVEIDFIEATLTYCNTPSTPSTITGLASVCSGTTGVAYSVTNDPNVTTYNWSVPAGATIASGVGTNSITVNFGSTSGNVSVTGTNICGTSGASTKAVTVNALPIAEITNNSGTTELTCTQTLINVTATGAGGGFYSWSGGFSAGTGVAANSFDAPGTYTVTVTDANGCTDQESIVISQKQQVAEHTHGMVVPHRELQQIVSLHRVLTLLLLHQLMVVQTRRVLLSHKILQHQQQVSPITVVQQS